MSAFHPKRRSQPVVLHRIARVFIFRYNCSDMMGIPATLLLASAAASSPRLVPIAYDIDASYNPAAEIFKAQAAISFGPTTAVDSFTFDLHGELQVTSVRA